MKKLNIAMIGYGFMGKAHSNAWRQVARFFDLPLEPVMKVICGRNEEEVRKAANKFGWQEHSTSWDKDIGRKDTDVTSTCIPRETHRAVPEKSEEAGKVVFCEKPL